MTPLTIIAGLIIAGVCTLVIALFVGWLLERYYSEMATKFYNENQKQLKRNRNDEQDT